MQLESLFEQCSDSVVIVNMVSPSLYYGKSHEDQIGSLEKVYIQHEVL